MTGRRAPDKWYTIRAAADGQPTEIMIYDEIGYFGVTARDFVRDLNAIADDEITVRINSPGGDVFDGIAILNALRGHRGRVTTIVDGLAASAASFIAMGGDEIVMRKYAELMIHDAWGMAVGNASDLRDLADQLDRSSDNIAAIYAERAGGTVEEWRELMRAEQWFTADEAVEVGLATRVDDDASHNAKVHKAAFDLSVFNYAGRRNAPEPAALTKLRRARAESDPGSTRTTDTADPSAADTGKERCDMADLSDELRTRLGLDADADDAAILAALDARVSTGDGDDGNDDGGENDGGNAESAPAAPVAGQSNALPDGAVVIDAEQLAALRSAAEAGAAARAQQQNEARAAVLNKAIREGKFPPSRREHYAKLLEADPEGTAAFIDSLAPGVVPVNEVGYGISNADRGESDDVRESDVYQNWSL